MSELKVGDKVRIIEEQSDKGKVGLIGIIRGVERDGSGYYQIEFPEGFDGHDCAGLIKGKRGWNVRFDKVELVKDELKNNKMDIEKVKKFDKSVIADAKAKVLEARAEKQTEEAVVVLTELFNKKDAIEEKVSEEQEELNAIRKDIKVFDVKK